MRHLNSFLTFFLLILIAILYTSCSYDQHLPEEEPVVTDTVFFADDILPIFNASCNTAGCHSTGNVVPDLAPGNAYNSLINGGYIDVDTPDNSELLQWMRGNRGLSMPLDGPDPEYNSLVLAWITQGAKNN
jgi:hypothetical protein